MIKEEQLKSILNSLRINVYDTPTYEISPEYDSYGACITIGNKENKNSIYIGLYNYRDKRIFGKQFHIKTKPFAIVEKYHSNTGWVTDNINISNELYDDFYSYIKERTLQDKFITETNVNSEYNLK